ncbi:hypothetical protein WICPIJ_006815, partial [Wickerhamomyces pijperi]
PHLLEGKSSNGRTRHQGSVGVLTDVEQDTNQWGTHGDHEQRHWSERPVGTHEESISQSLTLDSIVQSLDKGQDQSDNNNDDFSDDILLEEEAWNGKSVALDG